MRINQYISSSGFCSRREADRLIQNGQVTIDGALASVGMEVSTTSVVKVKGKLIETRPETVYLALNKPAGIESTTDQKKKNNIVDFIGFPERIFTVGRLDKDTTGLIILTNDGMIVNQILRSENNHEKEYIVEVDKPITTEFIRQMESGVEIYNPVQHVKVITKPSIVHKLSDNSFKLIITQGLNLQIRRMCQSLGFQVKQLKRIRIMNIEIGDLDIGKWRYLSKKEIEVLQSYINS
jgi:23S rRNA pseudouridine2604 synthase